MKKLGLVTTATVVLASFVLSGCAVKEADKPMEKVAKHAVNAPMYAVLAAGTLITYGVGLSLYGVKSGIDGVKYAAFNVEDITKKAEGGDSEAQFILGNAYHDGYKVEKDEKKAIYWFNLAAVQQHPKALYTLGTFHYDGHILDKDNKIALSYLEQASKYKFPNAADKLGDIYYNDIQLKDNKLSIQWYKKAINEGYNRSQCSMSYPILQESDYSKKAKEEAMKSVRSVIDGWRVGRYDEIKHCEAVLDVLKRQGTKG